jgi:5-hydroxyisourate hydrolase-like protein (transthyretin family)
LRKSRLLIYLFLFCLIFSACALQPRETTKEDPRTKGERHYDPLGFPQDQVIVTERESKEKKESITESEKDEEIRWKEPEKEKATLPRKVYRVQFFATQYPDEAQQMASTVRNQFSENTYIDYKAPYYWVRVGDCETKEEAETLLEKLRGLGYKESWVVEVKIEP